MEEKAADLENEIHKAPLYAFKICIQMPPAESEDAVFSAPCNKTGEKEAVHCSLPH